MAMNFRYVIPKEFDFVQSTPATEWTIEYPFLSVPAIDVFVDQGGTLFKVIPDNIQMITNNKIKIFFTTAYSGKARLIG
jgi:hypothetical protein